MAQFNYDPAQELFKRISSKKISATLGNDFKFGQSGVADAPAIQGTALTTPGSGLSLMPSEMSESMSKWGSGGSSLTDGAGTDVLGKWVSGAKMVADIGGIGLGIYNAMQQKKMNDYMRDFYDEQMALQKSDFNNQAVAANEALSARQSRLYDAMGMGVRGSAENEKAVGEYMSKWGAKTI